MDTIRYIITSEDFPAFKKLGGLQWQLPRTHDEWRKDFENVGDQLNKSRIPHRGVTVDPDEFSAYCRRAKVTPDLQHLQAFAEECAKKRTRKKN